MLSILAVVILYSTRETAKTPSTAARSPLVRLAAMPLAGLLTQRPANGAAEGGLLPPF